MEPVPEVRRAGVGGGGVGRGGLGGWVGWGGMGWVGVGVGVGGVHGVDGLRARQGRGGGEEGRGTTPETPRWLAGWTSVEGPSRPAAHCRGLLPPPTAGARGWEQLGRLAQNRKFGSCRAVLCCAVCCAVRCIRACRHASHLPRARAGRTRGGGSRAFPACFAGVGTHTSAWRVRGLVRVRTCMRVHAFVCTCARARETQRRHWPK